MLRKRALRSILTPMSSRALKLLRGLLVLSPALLLTGCSKVSGLGFEEGVTSVNDESLSLWQGAWIAAGVVGVFTLILILWPAVFHRLKKDSPEFPKQTQYNIPVEVLYTIIPFIIVAVLFYFTAQKQTVITAKTDTLNMKLLLWDFNGHGSSVIQQLALTPSLLVLPHSHLCSMFHWASAFVTQSQQMMLSTDSGFQLS